MIFCWAAFTAVLGCMQPTGCRLDTAACRCYLFAHTFFVFRIGAKPSPLIMVVARTKWVNVSRNPRTEPSRSKNWVGTSHPPKESSMSESWKAGHPYLLWLFGIWFSWKIISGPALTGEGEVGDFIDLSFLIWEPFTGGDLRTWKQSLCIDTTVEITPPRSWWDGIQEAKLPLQIPPSLAQMTEATAFFLSKGRNRGGAKSAVREPFRASDARVSGEGAWNSGILFWAFAMCSEILNVL